MVLQAAKMLVSAGKGWILCRNLRMRIGPRGIPQDSLNFPLGSMSLNIRGGQFAQQWGPDALLRRKR
jgi:hypothetical protein